MSEKNHYRSKYLKIRDSLTPEEIVAKSEIIQARLFELSEYKSSTSIFIYVNMGSEVQTIPIIQDAWAASKTVCVPVMKRMGEMSFVQLNSLDELEINRYGILEPKLDESLVRIPDKNTICVSPLVAYNKDNYRIGYGGGFYDRYLGKYRDLTAIGLAFSCQYLEKLPIDKYDMPLFRIITDEQ